MSAQGGPGSVGGFRAREEAAKAERERQRQAEASRRAQQSEAGKAAHRQAVLEAYRRGKETPGAQKSTVRTNFTKDTASSTVKTQDSGRSSSRDKRQFSQSGEPLQLQGDKVAIQEVRAAAFQRAREKAARTGGKVDQAAVNRETRAILAQSGGRVSVVDRAAQRENINRAYQDFKRDRSIRGESDFPTMTPAAGLKGRFVYEGFTESGAKTTAIISPPKVEKVTLGMEAPPNDPALGSINTLKNFITDLQTGSQGIGLGVGALFGGKPDSLIKQAGKVGTEANLRTERELEGELFGAGIQSAASLIMTGKADTSRFMEINKSVIESPAYFAGSAATSAAVWLSPFAAVKLSRLFSSIGPLGGIGRAARTTPQISTFTPKYAKKDLFEPTGKDDILPEFEKPIAATFAPLKQAKKMTTLADIDKRLGIGVKDKGDFSEVRTGTGQVLLLKKPVQVQKPITILSNPLQIVEQLFKTTTKTKSRQSTIFRPSELFRPAQETKTIKQIQDQAAKQNQQFNFRTGQKSLSMQQIARLTGFRQATTQKTSLERQLARMTQFKPITSEKQAFGSMFKTATAQRELFRFKQATQQSQQFRFDFNSMMRQITRTPTKPDKPFVPPFLLGGSKQKLKKGKKGSRIRAGPREGQIRDLITVALGTNSQLAREFNALFGKRF